MLSKKWHEKRSQLRRNRTKHEETVRLPSPSLSRIDALGVDVLEEISDYLEWPNDLRSLSLVSRITGSIARRRLYRIIPILAEQLSETQCLALLRRLHASVELRSYVTTLVFDQFLSPLVLAPNQDHSPSTIQSIDRALNRKQLKNPKAIVSCLLSLIPKLEYLKRVYLRYPHPGYITESLSPTSARLRVVSAVKWSLSMRAPAPLTKAESDIMVALGSLSEVRSLVIGYHHLPKGRPANYHNLTTLIIHGYGDPHLDDPAQTSTWNEVLRSCRSLKILGLARMRFAFKSLFDGCFFPHLDGIEWWAIQFSSTECPAAFIDFLARHSGTITSMVLAPFMFSRYAVGRDPEHQYPGFFVSEEHNWLNERVQMLVPRLRLLRLCNWLAFCKGSEGSSDFTQRNAFVHKIANFILSRPHLKEVIITNPPLEIYEENKLLAALGEEYGERIVTSDALEARRIACCGHKARGEDLSRDERWQAHRLYEYNTGLWMFYEVLFKGKALAESGYRPFVYPPEPSPWFL